MSWHTRSIERQCRECGGKATVELFNALNAPSGYYCARHGEAAAKRENRQQFGEVEP